MEIDGIFFCYAVAYIQAMRLPFAFLCFLIVYALNEALHHL